MRNRTRRMREAVTYWAPGEPDDYGNPQWAAPRIVMCRWQGKADLFTDTEAREIVSAAIVYPAEPLEPLGYLYRGESTEADPRKVQGAHMIGNVGDSPNLRQTETLNKAWVI